MHQSEQTIHCVSHAVCQRDLNHTHQLLASQISENVTVCKTRFVVCNRRRRQNGMNGKVKVYPVHPPTSRRRGADSLLFRKPHPCHELSSNAWDNPGHSSSYHPLHIYPSYRFHLPPFLSHPKTYIQLLSTPPVPISRLTPPAPTAPQHISRLNYPRGRLSLVNVLLPILRVANGQCEVTDVHGSCSSRGVAPRFRLP